MTTIHDKYNKPWMRIRTQWIPLAALMFASYIIGTELGILGAILVVIIVLSVIIPNATFLRYALDIIEALEQQLDEEKEQ